MLRAMNNPLARRPPWGIVLVVALTLGAAVYQVPHYRVPPEYQLPVFGGIIVFVAALAAGIYTGGRWAFVVDLLTVWIFPYETFIGVKPMPRGAILSALHIVAVIILIIHWQYFWKRSGDARG